VSIAMAEGKWISGLTADTPVHDAARRAILVRLDVVRHYLPLAVEEAEKDPEHIHQLRVGTRRAGAALDIFQVCFDEKDYATIRKALRSIRRAAGTARDWDVFLIQLSSHRVKLPAKQQYGLDFLFGHAFANRCQAQEHLLETSPAPHFEFDRVIAQAVAAVHKPDHSASGKTLGEMAIPTLAGLLREFEDAAACDLNDYDKLHRVRIVGKRLRYAMEIFADCFLAEFREVHYAAVEEMQEILGNANDCHVGIQRLNALQEILAAQWPHQARRYHSGIEGLLKHYQEELPKHRQQFIDWWNNWQQSGREQQLVKILMAPNES
jgi:CHAD domain-containing protein